MTKIVLEKLKRWFGVRSTLTNPDSWLSEILGGNQSYSGTVVNEKTAMTYAAFWACIRAIAKPIASLPLHLYERMDDGGRRKATDHHLYGLLHNKPNPEMTALVFRDVLTAHLLTWGNAYAEIQYNSGGQPVALWPLPPNIVFPERNDKTKEIQYRVLTNSGEVILRREQVFHLVGPGFDGLQGYSVVRMFRESIGMGLSVQEYGARFFGSGAKPGGVLEHPGRLKDPSGLRQQWKEMHSGLDNQHRIAILEEGMKYQQIGIPPEDAQFLECVVPGTLISMADGTRKKAEDIKAGDEVLGWDKGGPVKAKVAAVGIPPKKKLVKITTARGRELTASYDHPVLTKVRMRTAGGRPDKKEPVWIPIGELTEGNYVRVGLGNVSNGEYDRDKAWLLGALTGDGYLRKNGATFSNEDKEVVEKMRTSLALLDAELVKSKTREYDYVIKTGGVGCKGSPFRRFINKSGLVGKRSHEKRVPKEIMSGGVDAWAGFLSGYMDTDGSVSVKNRKKQPLAYWSSVNRSLLEDCQYLLSLLNINSAIHLICDEGIKKVNGYTVNTRKQWGLYVTGHSELFKLASILNLSHSQKKRKLNTFLTLKESRYRQENWMYDRVTSVECLEEGKIIGIEIADVHTHITNGLVTHNTRAFQRQEMAAIFQVPLHKLGDLTHATFSNIEHQGLEFYTDTLLYWLSLWEQSIQHKVIPQYEQDRYYAEFMVDALLRGDQESRYRAYSIAKQWGWLSTNDIRRKENENPIGPAGDIYWAPLNMVNAEELLNTGNKEVDDRTKHHLEIIRSATKEQRQIRAARTRSRLAKKYEQVFFDAIKKHLRNEIIDIKEAVKKFLGQRDLATFEVWLDDYYGNNEALKKQMKPAFTALAEIIFEEATFEVTGTKEKLSDDARQFMDEYLETFAYRYNDSSQGQLRYLVKKAMDEGLDIEETVETRLNEWEEKRPDKVAQNETVRIAGAIARVAFIAVGVTKLRWVAMGSKSCPYCKELDGKVIGVEEPFVNKHDTLDSEDGKMRIYKPAFHPPLHNACLCMLVHER